MPVPFFGISPKGDRIKSALAVSVSNEARPAITIAYFNDFMFGSNVEFISEQGVSTSLAITFCLNELVPFRFVEPPDSYSVTAQ